MKKSKLPKIIAFMNAFSSGASGGDVAMIEILKRINGFERKVVVTSALGRRLCQARGLKAEFLVTTREKKFSHVCLAYCKRILKGCHCEECNDEAIHLSGRLPRSHAFARNDRAGNDDVLYVSSDALPDVLPAYFWKKRNPQARWVQKIYHPIPRRRLLSRLAQRISWTLIKRNADVVITTNKLLRNGLIENGFAGNKIKINQLGIDWEFFNRIKPSTKKYTAAFLGRLHPSKGIFDLIKIWKRIVENKPESKLAIIGTGEEKIVRELRKEIGKCNLKKNIELCGYLSNEKAWSLVKNSQVFLFPSHEEGFGLAVGEALACGLPVVAYDLPVNKELWARVISTAPTGNVDEFARKVIDLLNDKKERTRLVKAGLKYVKELSWEKTAKREQEFLK